MLDESIESMGGVEVFSSDAMRGEVEFSAVLSRDFKAESWAGERDLK